MLGLVLPLAEPRSSRVLRASIPRVWSFCCSISPFEFASLAKRLVDKRQLAHPARWIRRPRILQFTRFFIVDSASPRSFASSSSTRPSPQKGARGPARQTYFFHSRNVRAGKCCCRYAGKIDVIYIDPPYNTGNEGCRWRKVRDLNAMSGRRRPVRADLTEASRVWKNGWVFWVVFPRVSSL
jgi:hypothetical protein